MESNSQLSERIVWLDWMKVWAIFFIIWGHFLSEGHLYLYVFSVQVFCIISGFLYKRSINWKFCFKKCFWGLFVPTLIMSVIMQLEPNLSCITLGKDCYSSILWFLKWFLLGYHWCLGPCWYFYSLIVMRLIMQALPERRWVYIVLFILLSVGAIFMSSSGVAISNANTNVLVCMPFFLIGVLLKSFKELFNGIHNFFGETALLVFAVSLVILCGHYNGYVWMYLCRYGNNYALYLLGGIAGSVMLYVVSLWLSRLPYRNMILTLSKGSIVIIGLHIVLVHRLEELPNRMWCEDMIFAILILFCFVPIIRLVELFFPLLLGKK